MTSRALVCLGLVAAMLAPACRPAKNAGGITSALQAAVISAEPAPLDVRYNPAPCECPPFEVLHDGRWERVFLDGPPAALAPAEALRSGDPLRTARLTARLDGRPRLGGNGVRYSVVVAQ